MKKFEFYFVNEDGEEQENLSHASYMLGLVDCLTCDFALKFIKSYEPVPLHYESLLKKCSPITCPKCGTTHIHKQDFETGEDIYLIKGQFVDHNQMTLF